jgi:hypothetical protein
MLLGYFRDGVTYKASNNYKKMATNLATQNPNATVETFLSNSTYNATTGEGNYILVRTASTTLPTGKPGYAIGCILQASDTGAEYTNTGTTTSATWTLQDSGTGLALPTTATDTTTTTGNSLALTGTAITSGVLVNGTISSAVLTTGDYLAFNDGAVNVFAIAKNGHIVLTQSVAPTIAVTTQAGISAAAITAGATDTNGIITTTGTSTGATVLTVTYAVPYATAPKTVIITPANASAAMPNTGYYASNSQTTSFIITVASGGTYAATPSLRYLVIG